MPKIRIDDRLLDVAEGTTILEAALASGIDIPHLCYHPAFEPEGNCRMCLVEIEGFPKLEPACSTQVKQDMSVSSLSPRVLESRKEVLEMLLAEHPLDCPICDKAGECRLQDYYERGGRFEGRFREAREKKSKIVFLGGKLILDRERCVLCLRCVRFLRQVTGTGELGVFQRGIKTEIGLYEGRSVETFYSGNLTDICPVGAITDADFRFRTRVWFLEKGESVCPRCGRGCGIIIDFLPGKSSGDEDRKVFRVRARPNPDVNGHWICNLGRYDYSDLGEKRERRIQMNKGGKTTFLSWEKALLLLAEKIKGLNELDKRPRLGLVLSSFLSNEELFLARHIFRRASGDPAVWFADPKPGTADAFLLTAERTPNLRGARELGFELRPPDLEAVSREIDVLVVFGNGLPDHFGLESIRAAFERIPAKFLFATHTGGLDDVVDVILPAALIAEKAGSLTNTEGRVQIFRPVWAAPGEARAEWEVLRDLAGELSAREPWMESPDQIREAMSRDHPSLRIGHD